MAVCQKTDAPPNLRSKIHQMHSDFLIFRSKITNIIQNLFRSKITKNYPKMKMILIIAMAGIVACGSIALTGCNVTRTITTTSSSVKRGDTTIIIQSKTIESYEASKKL